jgi:fructose-bisphosphate aldolase class II
MPLVTVANLYQSLLGGEHAIGAFNVHNMEYAQAVVRAAEETEAPVILMIGEPMIPFAELGMITSICRYAAETSRVPMAVSLDHGRSTAIIDRFIELGLSIMVDGSKFPFEENIRFTRRFAEKAHAAGLSIEGELGTIGGSEDGEKTGTSALTDPEAAAVFVEKTDVDALAVAIGNRHGLYGGAPSLDFDRLARIAELTPIPLVLHGGSDLPDEQVRRAVSIGIKKVNIGTDLKYAFAETLREVLGRHPMPHQPPDILGPAREAVYQVALEKLRLFGSGGLASVPPVS